ncbi:MAG: hypothetical protein M3040_02455 [Bacteroidota bacterium]|nr:hypothetical protein [Bacteroidota bacterium]
MLQQKEDVINSISRAINYLGSRQFHNGQFASYTAIDEPMHQYCQPDLNVFTTSIIGGCLLPLKDNEVVKKILQKTSSFLGKEMSPEGLWPHFSSRSNLHIYSSFDLDDTACASHLLSSLGNNEIRSRNTKLMLANRNNHYLYYSWFLFRFRFVWNYSYMKLLAKTLLQPKKYLLIYVTEASLNDVDAVVNANFLYYLGERAETKKIIEMIVKVIEENTELECDKWYKNIFTIYYFFSRCCNLKIESLDQIKNPIIQRILHLQNTDGSFGESSLDTALAISSLLHVGYAEKKLSTAIQALLTHQEADGKWKRYGFYFGGPKKLICFGSEELTTAVCIEALHKYQSS